VDKLEALISSYIRKWLGVPCCLSRVGVYSKGILQLPISALAEELAEEHRGQTGNDLSRVTQQMCKGGSTGVKNW